MITITWQTYLAASAVSLSSYYGIAALMIRFKGSAKSDQGKTITSNERQSGTSENEAVTPYSPSLFPGIFKKAKKPQKEESGANVQGLVDELQAFTSSVAGNANTTKDELIAAVKQIIRKYPGVAGSDMQSSITTLIAVSLENNCNIHLSADELSEIW